MEIRSVNCRYLELQVRLPRSLSGLEQRVKKAVSRQVSRGCLVVSLSCEHVEGKGRLTWDKSAIENYLRIFREVKQQYGLAGDISLSHLLQFSDFIKADVNSIDEEMAWRELQPLIEETVDDFQKSRETEGKYIVRQIKRCIRRMEELLKKIEKRAPVRRDAYISMCRKRIEELTGEGGAVDSQRLAVEVAFMADKLDIAEECTRLRAHVVQMVGTLDSSQPAGKRLGFIVQEMNREATTIAAKACDAEISHLSVELREEIEKIREQIQNVE